MGKRERYVPGYKIIERDIKRKDFSNLYFLYGEENYLLEESLTLLLDALIDKESRSFDLVIIEGEKAVAKTIIGASLSLPLLGQRKVVVVKAFDDLKSDEKNGLTPFLSEVPGSTTLILLANKRPDGRSKLASQVQKNGRMVEFKRPSVRELEAWVMDKFRQEGKSISSDGASLLVDMSGDDMIRLQNEVAKYILYLGHGEKEIKLHDIRKMSPNTVERTIFEFTDAVGRRDTALALSKLEELLSKGQHYTMVLFMLVRQVRMLMRTRLMMDRGASHSSEILPSLPIRSPYEAEKFFQQAENFNSQELASILKRLQEADVKIKTGRVEPKLELELVVMELCGKGSKWRH